MGESCLGSYRKTFRAPYRLTMPRITPLHWRRLEKVFIASGFSLARSEGSHRSYVKEGVLRPIVIPTYDAVPVSIIRTNLKTAGISRDEYFRLLK